MNEQSITWFSGDRPAGGTVYVKPPTSSGLIAVKNEAGLECRYGPDVETICKAWWGDDIDIWLNIDKLSGEALRNGEVIAEFTVYYNAGFIHPEPSITCPGCSRKSYNPNDIANRYCGFCGYHDGSLTK